MRLIHSALGLSLLMSVPFACAHSDAWQLVPEHSAVHFVSIKKESIAETHHFKSLQGHVANSVAELRIDLTSVETNIPIRNERMLEHLFETAQFPQAKVSLNIDQQSLAKLKVGESMQLSVEAQLTLHGKTNPLSTTLKVSKLSESTLLATSVAPIMIDAAQYALQPGVEKLKQLAGLPSISLMVPVTINLQFAVKNETHSH